MRIWICLFLLLSFTPFVMAKKKEGSVKLTLVSQRAAQTADPNNQLYEYTVTCQNTGSEPVDLSNNQFFVKDSAGGNHFVDRVKRADRATVAPGKSYTFDRIYISVPRNLKPVELHLRGLGSVLIK